MEARRQRLLALVVAGMSRDGGNRDDCGWKLLGLDAGHASWQPPFGYYDAEYVSQSGVQGERHGD